MKHYSLKLRKILLYDSLYYILIILSLIYIFIYSKTFILNTNYNKNNNKFYLKINNYIIDGNKLSIDFDNLKGIYYFETQDEINLFKKKKIKCKNIPEVAAYILCNVNYTEDDLKKITDPDVAEQICTKISKSFIFKDYKRLMY